MPIKWVKQWRSGLRYTVILLTLFGHFFRVKNITPSSYWEEEVTQFLKTVFESSHITTYYPLPKNVIHRDIKKNAVINGALCWCQLASSNYYCTCRRIQLHQQCLFFCFITQRNCLVILRYFLTLMWFITKIIGKESLCPPPLHTSFLKWE